ncbi:MAG: hypothetical protein ACYTAS_08680 [Planctomycetota bacterium]|jgi:hypothetical protein
MTPLNNQQEQLIFDYAMGLTSAADAIQARELLETTPATVHIYETLRSALAPLDAVPLESCPDDLAQRTVACLKERARADSSEDRLEKLLEAERTAGTPIRIPFWRNWGDIAAVAAVLVLFVGIVLPALGYARQSYQQQRCQTQLASVYGGVASYVSDHNGRMPRVPMAPGSPWWKVGYQGAENYSNTRQAWILVKQGYVDPSRFICPGRPESRALRFDTLQIANYNDFPSPAYIHFSVRVCCPQSKEQGLAGRRAIFADRNPLSEQLPTDYSAPFAVRLCQELMTSNSRNHNRRGQNVLFCDGSIEFTRRRFASVSRDDDIYTLSDMTDGCEVRGIEVPSCETDAFLAP